MKLNPPKGSPMPAKTLTAACFLGLRPIYKRGVLQGFTVSKVTKRAPGEARSVRLVLKVPASAFEPFRAELEVPEGSMVCAAEAEEPEA